MQITKKTITIRDLCKIIVMIMMAVYMDMLMENTDYGWDRRLINDNEEMQGDHIVPWSKGGRTIDDISKMLCQKCNNDTKWYSLRVLLKVPFLFSNKKKDA